MEKFANKRQHTTQVELRNRSCWNGCGSILELAHVTPLSASIGWRSLLRPPFPSLPPISDTTPWLRATLG
eukprot:1724697-Amphidinium_carterae.1